MANVKKTGLPAGSHAESVKRDTVDAGNVVKGSTEPTSRRDLKHDTVVEDVQAKINKEVEEAQSAKGSTASDKPGPKA
jgi:hypothetical protein